MKINPLSTFVVAPLLLSLVIIASGAWATDLIEPPIPVVPTLSETLGSGLGEFANGLDASQRKEALYAFEDKERFDLRLAPLGLEGLTLNDMSEAQWKELEGLIGQVLSPTGLSKVNTIRSLEHEVAKTENGFFGFLMRRIRDTKRYFLTIYGEPEADSIWGLRFDGHHLSLNWTQVPGAPLSATPLFFGGQPRVVPEGLDRAGLRVLADEEEIAVQLINSLSTSQRSQARIPWLEGGAFQRPMSVTGEADLELPKQLGLSRTDLSTESQAQLDALIEVHLSTFVPAIADRTRAKLYESPQSIGFVFASITESETDPIQSGRALYYRLLGGGIVIEFDDTAVAADHIHVVIRDGEGDFGRDVLREHRTAHHPR